jgi:putative nucleotidyltransferase with HDIG domain
MDVFRAKNAVPTEDECLAIMEGCNAFPNIIAHSIQVKNVAVVITDNLLENTPINRNLVISGALLHDIAKTKSILENKHRHDLMGAAMLHELGLDDEAFICETHIILKDFLPDGPLLETEIVHYADKRVKHDIVVSIDERLEDLVERYGTSVEKRQSLSKDRGFIEKLEKKINSYMKIDIEAAISSL